MHVGYPSLAGDLNGVIADALALGCTRVVCSWWPPAGVVSAAAAESIGERLGEIGARLRPYGIRFGFHNHDHEFRVFDGRPAFAWMLGAAAPRDLFAEVDVYWVAHAGLSPAQFLRDHGARVPLVHLKDSKELGTGPVDFEAVFAACDAIGAVEWYIVEQENFSHDPLESVRLCHAKLREWGRA
jgi:sugar phosphate isomerase/epimerase